MRKINLDPYMVEVKNPDGSKESIPYIVRESLINSLYHSDLKLNARALLENDRVAQKIKNTLENVVLLEEAEYSRLRSAFEVLTGLGSNEVELVRRVLDAPEITVKEG